MKIDLKKTYAFAAVATFTLIPLLPWLTLKPLHERFGSADLLLTSISQVSALLGTTLFALFLISKSNTQATRYFFEENSQEIPLTSIMSSTSFLLLMTHPIVILIGLMSDNLTNISFTENSLALYFGIYATLLLVSLYISRFFARQKNQTLKSAPVVMTSILFLGTFHAFFIPSSLSESFFIKSYILGIVSIAIIFQVHKGLTYLLSPTRKARKTERQTTFIS